MRRLSSKRVVLVPLLLVALLFAACSNIEMQDGSVVSVNEHFSQQGQTFTIAPAVSFGCNITVSQTSGTLPSITQQIVIPGKIDCGGKLVKRVNIIIEYDQQWDASTVPA